MTFNTQRYSFLVKQKKKICYILLIFKALDIIQQTLINYFVKLGWTYVEDMLTRVGSEMLLFKKQINSVQDAKEGLILKEGLKK